MSKQVARREWKPVVIWSIDLIYQWSDWIWSFNIIDLSDNLIIWSNWLIDFYQSSNRSDRLIDLIWSIVMIDQSNESSNQMIRSVPHQRGTWRCSQSTHRVCTRTRCLRARWTGTWSRCPSTCSRAPPAGAAWRRRRSARRRVDDRLPPKSDRIFR